MKRETVNEILARIDPQYERPLPASSERFDVSRKYRIVSGESLDYADDLNAAKLIAGEWLAERDRVVEIVKQRGIPKRWAAHPVWDGNELEVELQPLFADLYPEDVGSRRLAALAKHIERERWRRKKRRQRKRRLAEKKAAAALAFPMSGHLPKAVVCIDPAKPFASVVDAAKWAGVRQPTLARAIKKGFRCGGFQFRLAGDVLQEMHGFHHHTSLIRAATEAVRLARQKSRVDDQPGGANEPDKSDARL